MYEPPPIETIVYQPYLLAYVDILGFRDRINTTRKDPHEIQQTYALLHSMKDYSAAQRFYSSEVGPPRCLSHFQAFSDLIIRATELNNKRLLSDVLNFECMILAHAQCREIFSSGILLRGAICIGDLFIGDHATFGPALIDAYDIESQIAVFPRIVIDHELLRTARETATQPIWDDHITRGEDGVYFVDYLFGQCLDRWSFPEENSLDMFGMLESHQNFVQELLKIWTERTEYRKRQKAIWLANYHNMTVNRLRVRLSRYAGPEKFGQTTIDERLYQF
jgi:hypothetical protein